MTKNANGANPTHRWFDDFLDESDRGCVLIAHAIIEERLGDLIEAHLLATFDGQRKLVADLRQRRGNAMGSCPACIFYASKLGLISTHMAGALQQINDLRNAFAHYKQPRETRIVASHAKAIFDLLTPAQRRGAVAARTLFGPKMNEASHSPARQEFEAAACVLIADIDQLMPHRKSVGRPKLTRSSQVMPRFSIRQRASAPRQGQRACRTPGAGTGETKGEVGMRTKSAFRLLPRLCSPLRPWWAVTPQRPQHRRRMSRAKGPSTRASSTWRLTVFPRPSASIQTTSWRTGVSHFP